MRPCKQREDVEIVTLIALTNMTCALNTGSRMEQPIYAATTSLQATCLFKLPHLLRATSLASDSMRMGAIVQTMATETFEGNLPMFLHVETNVAHGLQIHAGSGCNANACITVQLAACVFCVQVLFVCGMSTRSTKAILKLHFIGCCESLHVGRNCYSCWHVFSRLKRAS